MADMVTPAARRLLEEHGLQASEVPRALSHRDSRDRGEAHGTRKKNTA